MSAVAILAENLQREIEVGVRSVSTPPEVLQVLSVDFRKLSRLVSHFEKPREVNWESRSTNKAKGIEQEATQSCFTNCTTVYHEGIPARPSEQVTRPCNFRQHDRASQKCTIVSSSGNLSRVSKFGMSHSHDRAILYSTVVLFKLTRSCNPFVRSCRVPCSWV